MSSSSSSSDERDTHNNTNAKKVYRHVDVVSFADLCLEADVILESSLNSNSGAASAHFHQNHFPEKIKKIKKSESGHQATENTPKEVVSFPRSMTKRLKSAFALFSSSSSSLNEMNSNEWLDLLRRSNLLSNGFSDARASRCFENIIFAGDFTPDDEDEDEDENNDDGNGRRRRSSSINFDQFLHLLARKVAKAYDVEAKVVGKRVVATAYAIERRREEEARKEEEEEGESDDDDDSDGYREYDGCENNVFSNRRRRAMTMMPPPATTHHTTAAAASSLGVSSSWRVRAAEYTNRYRNSNNNDINFTRALIGYQNNEVDEDAKIEDILLEDRVANAFETTFCQSSSKTTRTPPTTINEREFVKICAACAFIGNGFTASNCSDLAFAVGRERRRQRRRGRKGEDQEEEERLTGVEIDARAFLVGLREIASVHDVSFADVAERVLRLLSSNSSSSSRRSGGQSTKISWG